MKIINTSTTDFKTLTPFERSQIYNGLDCTVTSEVLSVLLPQLDNHTGGTYNFSRSLQGPVLEMRLRGVLVDAIRRGEVVEEYHEKLEAFEESLEEIVRGACGMFGFNWRSPTQLMELFYDRLGIPPIRRLGRPTVNRDALEKMEVYPIAMAICFHIKCLRDLGKKISVLKTEIDPDGRVRTSYNIGGTTTGRLSSSFSEFGTGTNLQNIEEALRSIFIADPGMKMAYADAQQGESRCVGAIEWNLFGDGTYLNACERGDLHTNVAKLVWPNLGWTNDAERDRELAEEPYYRHYDRRFMCKKIGHGSNYGGKPRTLGIQAHVEQDLIEDFQPKYFAAFPAHQRWHAHVEGQIRRSGYLISLTGRKRCFWGRRDDPAVLREAIAFDPQGSLADILNRGMLKVWEANQCQLLMQIHDAILFQYPQEAEDEIIPLVLDQLRYPIQLEGRREFTIPYEVKTGWNWGKYHGTSNPDGLKAWAGGDKRRRTPYIGILDRPIRRVRA
jgi:DNA polymerase-1